MRKIITISCKFGCNNREIGKRLVDYFDINYFVRKIVKELSKQTNLNKNYLDDNIENWTCPLKIYKLLYSLHY